MFPVPLFASPLLSFISRRKKMTCRNEEKGPHTPTRNNQQKITIVGIQTKIANVYRIQFPLLVLVVLVTSLFFIPCIWRQRVGLSPHTHTPFFILTVLLLFCQKKGDCQR